MEKLTQADLDMVTGAMCRVIDNASRSGGAMFFVNDRCRARQGCSGDVVLMPMISGGPGGGAYVLLEHIPLKVVLRARDTRDSIGLYRAISRRMCNQLKEMAAEMTKPE